MPYRVAPSRRRALPVGLLAALLLLLWPAAAFAHTEFESSTPADGDVVEGPVSDIVVRFTNPARPAGDGFQLLDPSGEIRVPTSIDETDGTSFVLSFDPPLVAGTYGVRWQVRAGDAHPIDGSFRFEVVEPAAPATTAAVTTTIDPQASTVGAPVPTTVVPPTTTAVPPTTEALPPTTPSSAEADLSLEAFLDGDGSGDDGATIGQIGRTLTFLGLISGAGAVAALLWVIRGRRDELLTQLSWIRLAGLVVATGGLLELASLQATASEGVLDQLTTRAGVAAALKFAGGLAVLAGFHRRAGHFVAPPRAVSAAVATEVSMPLHTGGGHEAEHRWVPTPAAWLGLAGFATVFASFWFDGHTVSKGPWFLHATVNLVHLVAAAVWGGGVVAMTAIAWMRRRSDERSDLAGMIVRFSTPATVSLLAVFGAGLVMAVMILDRPGDVVATEWGRVLLAKTGAVAVAAGMGAFNHFRLRPALERSPDDRGLARELRISLSIESVVFVAIIVLTAWLVAAAT